MRANFWRWTVERHLELVERTIAEALASLGRPAALAEAMRHGVGSGGKRLRPLICCEAAEAVGGSAQDARWAAAAIELIHNYTLVHDDLPAMDNDEMRRGAPSVWAKYGEGNAILAGDALQALAFRILAKTPERRTGALAKILEVFGRAAVGVVAGQVEDIAAANGGFSRDTLDFVFSHKTADLFMCAAEAGALAGGASDEDAARLRDYAFHLGVAFQYEDDLLDGDDGAFSSLSLMDEAEIKAEIARHTEAAVKALEGVPGDASRLVTLVRRLVGRKV